MQRFCTECGSQLNETARFCTVCGVKQEITTNLENSQPAPVVEQSAQSQELENVSVTPVSVPVSANEKEPVIAAVQTEENDTIATTNTQSAPTPPPFYQQNETQSDNYAKAPNFNNYAQPTDKPTKGSAAAGIFITLAVLIIAAIVLIVIIASKSGDYNEFAKNLGVTIQESGIIFSACSL